VSVLERLASALADRYRVEGELGTGGMATVYLAHDLKHDRDVAMKVLHPDLGAALGGERFLSEIRTTARLQHPHILPLLDSGEAGSLLYYVMPLVTGETLRARLEREKQLPIADAVLIAREVADALHYAHSLGVIHRDIKPENILLQNGHALVADFGIALAVQSAGGARMTQTGLSLGTPQYMSPEQAMGERTIDARSDIYAIAAVTYEMLTGDPPFTGSTVQAIVAKVLSEKPQAIHTVRDTVPLGAEQAVLRALSKLPADRFASAGEFAAALASPGPATQATTSAAVGGRTASPRSRVLMAGLAAVAIVSTTLAAWGWLRPAPPSRVIRYSMGLPPGQEMKQGLQGNNVAISPDGSRIVYVGPGEGGDQLWLRERDRLEATPLPGTVGALNPFFSPDGQRIAFFSGVNLKLKIIPVAGGTPVTLATAGRGSTGGGAWGAGGWIYFESLGGISRIQQDGSTPELFIPFDTIAHDVGYARLAALPNGKGLLYRARRNMDPADFDIVAFDFKTRERHILTKGAMARYVDPGYLVLLRNDGALFAAPFDQDRLRMTGTAVRLLEGVMMKAVGSADLAISPAGTLVYVSGASSNTSDAASVSAGAELVWVSREGAVTPLNPPVTYNPAVTSSISVSPSGTRAAIDAIGPSSFDIWITKIPSGPMSRLTFGNKAAYGPQWTPDERSVVYTQAVGDEPAAVWKKKADGSAAPELLWRVPRREVVLASLSRDGQWLTYDMKSEGGSWDVYAVRPGRDTVATPILTDRFDKMGALVSPDGKWLAYASNETGRSEIFVRPFPNTAGGRWQISTAGGSAARWAHSGRELFYQSPSGDMMVVPVKSGPTFAPGAPTRLFTLGGLWESTEVPLYDLATDDKRLLMLRTATGKQAPGAGSLVVVDNWFTELKAKMGSKQK
jgi:Tol biopolymer transport system component